MVLNTAGIAAGWHVELMPQARLMLDAVLLPDGRVFMVNGAQTGVAGYGNVGINRGNFSKLLIRFFRSGTRLERRMQTTLHSKALYTIPLLLREFDFLKRTFRSRPLHECIILLQA
jgi:hypothetical protein